MDYGYARQPLNTYVSRVIPLVADDAGAAFDVWRHDITNSNGQAPAHWGLRQVPAAFKLDGIGLRGCGVIRAVAGDIVVGRSRISFPVEVELVPWSERVTELGIRAVGRRGRRLLSGGWPADRYFAAAHALAEELSGALALLARLPSARTQPVPATGPTVRPHLRLVRYGDC